MSWGASIVAPGRARHRHFGQRDQQAAIGQVMAGGDVTGADLSPYEVAVAPLDREIDRRRCAFLAAMQSHAGRSTGRAMALGVADQHEGEAFLDAGAMPAAGRDVSRSRRRAPMTRSRQDRTAFGLVVERDVARHDREVERTCRPRPCP